MPPPAPAPIARVEVVVLNWNGLDDTLACLRALRAQTRRPDGVTVVDNGSLGDEADRLQAALQPGERLLRSAANLGFAGGCNLALARLLADGTPGGVVLLNNDTEPEPDWLATLLAATAARPDVALWASHMVFHDAPATTENAGIDVLWTGDAVPRGRHRPRAAFAAPAALAGACGGALLARLDVLAAIGTFHDDFFAVFEDVDLSLRALACGHEIAFAPGAVVRHKLNRTIRKVRTAAFDARSARNLTHAVAVNLPWPALLAVALPMAGAWLVQPLVALLLLRPRRAATLVAGRLRAVGELGTIARRRAALRPRRRGSAWRLLARLRSPFSAYAGLLRRQLLE